MIATDTVSTITGSSTYGTRLSGLGVIPALLNAAIEL